MRKEKKKTEFFSNGFFILLMLMLTSAFRTIDNKSFQKIFYTTSMVNRKNVKKLIIFLFSRKKYLKIFSKPMSLRHLLTFFYFFLK